MKIGVYYIVTGPYIDYLDGFLTSLQNFFPEDEKIVKLISDNGEKYKDYNIGSVKIDLCPRINHYPWPIVTLYKHWHILQNWDDTCDYVCYFNANSIISKNNPNEWCNFEKLNVSYHSFSRNHVPMYPNAYKTKKESCAYIEPQSYEYIQGGFFFGKNSMVKQFCKDVVNMVNKDSEQQIYAEWHDETYANKWVNEHLDLVNKKFILTVYPEYLNNETFIQLPTKNKNIVNFKGF